MGKTAITTVGNRGYIAMYADSSTEQDPIGGSSFTEKEWDKLLSEVDDITEEMREVMREEHQKRLDKSLEDKTEVRDS